MIARVKISSTNDTTFQGTFWGQTIRQAVDRALVEVYDHVKYAPEGEWQTVKIEVKREE